METKNKINFIHQKRYFQKLHNFLPNNSFKTYCMLRAKRFICINSGINIACAAALFLQIMEDRF